MMLLRLVRPAAPRAHHHRVATDELAARGRAAELRFPARWLKDHPLSGEDLRWKSTICACRG
jgi:hypothetical protein